MNETKQCASVSNVGRPMPNRRSLRVWRNSPKSQLTRTTVGASHAAESQTKPKADGPVSTCGLVCRYEQPSQMQYTIQDPPQDGRKQPPNPIQTCLSHASTMPPNNQAEHREGIPDTCVTSVKFSPPGTRLSCPEHPSDLASAVLSVEREMSVQLAPDSFVGGSITHVYSPLEYAWAPHCDFVRRYVRGDGVRFLLVGMNPGPWGMSQNGVPFGEVAAVRDWLLVRGDVVPPSGEHLLRPVTGLRCTRSEVSGRRFWALWRRLCGTPERLFRHAFVYNLCPLAFMQRSARNVTPNQLAAPLQRRLEAVCRPALARIVQILGVRSVIGVGRYAEQQARLALRDASLQHVTVYPLLHPSPCSPQANKDWEGVASRQLTEAGLLQLLTSQ